MDDAAVEKKLERINWNARLALEAFDITSMSDEMRRAEVMRRLGIIIAASQPFATRWLNFIPDPIDNIGDYEKDELKEMGPDYDAMGNEAGMDEDAPPTGTTDLF